MTGLRTTLVVALTLLAGGAWVSPAGGVSPVPTRTASGSSAAPRAGVAGAAYVALGDSYSAGEGLGAYERGTDVAKGSERNQCHRSLSGAYAVLRTVLLPQVTSRAFFACSGATSEDMRSVPPQTGDGRQVGQPRQTSTVGAQTRFVSLSAGGNDVDFGGLGQRCVQAAIARRALVRIGGRSCKAQVSSSRQQLDATRRSLITLYGELLARAPKATVVVLGYPRVLPPTYDRVPHVKGKPFCVLDHYAAGGIDVGLPVSDARLLDAFSRSLNSTIRAAVSSVQAARPGQRGQLRYADSYSASTPNNCRGTTQSPTVNAVRLTLGHGISGPKLRDKLTKLWVSPATLHPTASGQRLFATVVQQAFTAPTSTTITRQNPVTAQASIAPGFTVTASSPTGHCNEGSDVGQAYRCFSGNGVFDPCYAVAEPTTGDGTGVVCPTSPFGRSLFAITYATGLGPLTPDAYDEPNGLVLAGGLRCIQAQGAHDADTAGRVIDYACDDGRTSVLRGLHKTAPLWTADVARRSNGRSVAAGSQPIVSAVLIQHDVPPANRPVTDAGGASVDDLDAFARVHHEVDCGEEDTVAASSGAEQIFASQATCAESSLVVTEWDNNDDLEPGWTCTYSDGGTLLCQQAEAVSDSPPGFFSAAHLRAIAVG